MKTIRRDTIRKLYREGMIQIFGCGDKDLDKDLIRAMKKDMHIAGQAPGGWVSEEAVLEIYCESGIPNATDINDFSCYADEFGSNPADMVSYNSDKWCQLDEYVNLYLKSVGRSERVHHEPFNGAVIGIYWS
jgi:hypothetical protein|tara:strand:- start:195 stop:590 length:396 start_codon:yes stop_codon:yes gene_type:complete